MQSIIFQKWEDNQGGKLFRFEDIGDKGLKIILYLYICERGRVTDFFNHLSMGKSTVYRAIRYLDKYGIIKEEKIGAEKFYTLTERGKKVAKYIYDLEKELGNGLEEVKDRLCGITQGSEAPSE